MLIAVCGKTNVGKTTFFSASTLVDAEISSRVFTTIEPNRGVSYVRAECPCKKLGIKCSPKNSLCIEGTRFVPVKMIDIAGLVPDAHKGRGLGNQFLDDIMEASALIHVIDISGSTDSEGRIVPAGTHDPQEDVRFFEKEIDYWLAGIVKRAFGQISKRIEGKQETLVEAVFRHLSGLGIRQDDVETAMLEHDFGVHSTEEDILPFVSALRAKSKPIIIAANKIDIHGADEIFEKTSATLKAAKSSFPITPCSAETELALRRAAEHGLISYMPGDSDFKALAELDDKRKTALEFIRENVLKKYGSTGVQNIINKAVFDILNMIIVYPVENEHKLSDKKGNVLPDAHLVPKGTTALELAYRVHEDIGKHFIAAVDCKTRRRLGAGSVLHDGDIISIKAGG